MKQVITWSVSAFYTDKMRIALVFFAMLLVLSLGCASTPRVPVTWDQDTVNLMPKEVAIEYLNTVNWLPVWGKSCCTFTEKGVYHPTVFGKGSLAPYSELSMWANGPWPDGTYQIGLSLPNVNALYIVPVGSEVPPAEATRIITALEVLISTRTKR
ncbi:MAG: hypothetical protein K8S13_07665 [Desulfobacula sp.]|uniref:hypothetical protein n=1 Tax=Desulfobacula sp. TaxID=2593537 RepID=UPI0025BD2467|nr:hypothetical protein [Desulfobacula sp.]MCD4719726.1 hypothetical protein [Desulfobacula sp.]